MYTVIRFQASERTAHLLQLYGERINELIPNFYRGVDEHPNRFSATVFSDGRLSEHLAAIHQLLERITGIITEAVADGLKLVIDIAIEPEDQTQVLHFEPELLSILAKNSVALEFTDYRQKR